MTNWLEYWPVIVWLFGTFAAAIIAAFRTGKMKGSLENKLTTIQEDITGVRILLEGQITQIRADVRPMKDDMEKIKRMIAPDALEKGYQIQTIPECDRRRAKCPGAVSSESIIQALADDIKDLLESHRTDSLKNRTALTMLINNISEPVAREEILKVLL